MEELLEKIAICVEKGKMDIKSPYPPDMKGEEGAYELTKQALDQNIPPDDILKKSLMVGMSRIGEKFSNGQAFVPNLLLAAKAMNSAMEHLNPFFASGEVHHKGKFVLGTVKGDLHDIGKNLVKMVMKGGGWDVIDLGVDVGPDKFLEAAKENPGCVVGMSALLTTTMMNMEEVVKVLREHDADIQIFVGGAPLSTQFSENIGANGYFADPHSFTKHFPSAN